MTIFSMVLIGQRWHSALETERSAVESNGQAWVAGMPICQSRL
jgi:hypothetical protein